VDVTSDVELESQPGNSIGEEGVYEEYDDEDSSEFPPALAGKR
jgi:hypothetical protein